MGSFLCLLLWLLVAQSRAFLFRSPSHASAIWAPSSFVLSATSAAEYEINLDVLEDKRVLVAGGSGRVGGSVVTQLLKRGAKVTVGGTRLESYEKAKRRWVEKFPTIDATAIEFATIDRECADSVSSVLSSCQFDLVVHTAGPFQGKATTSNGVIDAAVANGVPYVDVCDDYCTASAAKTKFSQKAQDSQVPCIISTGCWVSSLWK